MAGAGDLYQKMMMASYLGNMNNRQALGVLLGGLLGSAWMKHLSNRHAKNQTYGYARANPENGQGGADAGNPYSFDASKWLPYGEAPAQQGSSYDEMQQRLGGFNIGSDGNVVNMAGAETGIGDAASRANLGNSPLNSFGFDIQRFF